MSHNKNNVSVNGTMILLLVFLNAFILKVGFIYNESFYNALIITVPLLSVSVYSNYKKSRHSNRMSIDELHFPKSVSTFGSDRAEEVLPAIPDGFMKAGA